MGMHSDQLTLVSLSYTRSYCENSRGKLLLNILITGIVCGLLINVPLFLGVGVAIARYFRRLREPEEDGLPPENTTIRAPVLRLLQIDSAFDMDDGSSKAQGGGTGKQSSQKMLLSKSTPQGSSSKKTFVGSSATLGGSTITPLVVKRSDSSSDDGSIQGLVEV